MLGKFDVQNHGIIGIDKKPLLYDNLNIQFLLF